MIIEILIIAFLYPIVVTISHLLKLNVDVYMKLQGIEKVKERMNKSHDKRVAKSPINGDYGRQ